MNRKILKSRYIQVIFFVVILMLILCVRLFVLTVVQEEKWAEAAKNQNTKEVLLSAPRGKIYDRYGRVLAGTVHRADQRFRISDDPPAGKKRGYLCGQFSD